MHGAFILKQARISRTILIYQDSMKKVCSLNVYIERFEAPFKLFIPSRLDLLDGRWKGRNG